MSLSKERTHTPDCIQEERITYHLECLEEFLQQLRDDLDNYVKEAHADLNLFARNLKFLKEAIYAPK